MNCQKLINQSSYAKFRGVSRQTIYDWVAKGGIPSPLRTRLVSAILSYTLTTIPNSILPISERASSSDKPYSLARTRVLFR